MREKKNIDRLFQEKFKDFEAHPNKNVWKNISAAQKDKNDSKVVPLWWKVSGIAAVLIILLSVGALFFTPLDTKNSEIVEESDYPQNISPGLDINQTSVDKSQKLITSQSSNNNNTPETTNSPSQKESTETLSTSENTTLAITNTVSKKTTVRTNASSKQGLESTKNKTSSTNSLIAYQGNGKTKNPSLASNTAKNNSKNSFKTNKTAVIDRIVENDQNTSKDIAQADTSATKEEKKDLVAEALKIQTSKEEESLAQLDEKTHLNRWDVGATAAPVFYGDFGGSGLDKQFANNDKSGDVNLSYGVNVSYAVTPKFKIRTGLNTVDLSYNTNGISFSADGLGRSIRGADFSENARALSVVNNPASQNNSTSNESLAAFQTTADGSLQQQLSYLEVPLEAIYVISDRRIGFSLIGGVSTLFLNDNDVVLRSPELTTSLGTSSGANEVSFTTNLGVGLDYKVTDKIMFNIEPSLKYQLNSFDNSVVDFQPYYLGVYTGVSYKF